MSEKTTICGYTEAEIKEQLQRESALRGDTLSQALSYALKYGLPVYMKRHPVRFVPVEEKQSDAPAAA